MNFWHTFDSGSKFKILKPNSSWLTFGISKFVSLSISHFLFLFFLNFFYIVLSYTNSLAITSQNHYYFGYYISKVLLFWLLHLKSYIILAITSKFTTVLAITFQITIILAIPSQNFNFILLYQTQHRYQLPHQTL